MIARLIPESVDIQGTPVSRPCKKHIFHPTFPIEAYLTQPLSVYCRNLDEMQAFLAGCRYASDESLVGEKDYWSPPEEFEKRRQGDCDCAAIWAWRQLIEMGIEARFVLGLTGTARGHHAWVFFRDDGEWYALEPFAAIGGRGFPQLHTLWYLPRFSAAWDGAAVRYFEHSEVVYRPSLLLLIKLTAASIGYHANGWARVIFMLLRVLPKAGLNALRRGRRNNGKRLTLG